MFCFFHDQFVKEDEVAISVHDRGFTLGDGVFDTQLANDGHLWDADLHFERILHDATILGIPLEKTIFELKTISTMLLARNSIASGRWVVRTQVTRGLSARGLAPPTVTHPTIVMRAIPAPPINDAPVNAIIAETVRRNEHSPFSRIKSLNYGDNILALMEAQETGVQDAILLNTEGHVACMTSSNIFIVEDGIWITPPISDGVLAGITRQKLIGEHKAREDHITVERLKKAQEIWHCNSVIGLQRVLLSQDAVQ